jgi:hypothetical protein
MDASAATAMHYKAVYNAQLAAGHFIKPITNHTEDKV